MTDIFQKIEIAHQDVHDSHILAEITGDKFQTYWERKIPGGPHNASAKTPGTERESNTFDAVKNHLETLLSEAGFSSSTKNNSPMKGKY